MGCMSVRGEDVYVVGCVCVHVCARVVCVRTRMQGGVADITSSACIQSCGRVCVAPLVPHTLSLWLLARIVGGRCMPFCVRVRVRARRVHMCNTWFQCSCVSRCTRRAFSVTRPYIHKESLSYYYYHRE